MKISLRNLRILPQNWKKISTPKILLITKWNGGIWSSWSERSKIRANNNRKIKIDLENKLKDLQNDLNTDDEVQEYVKTKFKLEEVYEKFVDGAKVRCKCTWHEEGEKATFFLDLKKRAF